MKPPYVVVFAGAPGSSKSIVAHELSMRFNLPILKRDVIRAEVKEDMRVHDIRHPAAQEEFEERFDKRWRKALSEKRPFILDSSVDRNWDKVKQQLREAGFRWFMIDMELSRAFFEKLFEATKRPKAIAQLSGYLDDHEKFMKRYADNVNVTITDKTFPKRIDLATEALEEFLR